MLLLPGSPAREALCEARVGGGQRMGRGRQSGSRLSRGRPGSASRQSARMGSAEDEVACDHGAVPGDLQVAGRRPPRDPAVGHFSAVCPLSPPHTPGPGVGSLRGTASFILGFVVFFDARRSPASESSAVSGGAPWGVPTGRPHRVPCPAGAPGSRDSRS